MVWPMNYFRLPSRACTYDGGETGLSPVKLELSDRQIFPVRSPRHRYVAIASGLTERKKARTGLRWSGGA